jgi:hypothetical protein
MNNDLQALKNTKTILLTTYKRETEHPSPRR